MEDVTDKILTLLESFLGEWGKSSGGWHSFNCPCCAEEDMVERDGKYNLEVMVDPESSGGGGYHCWKCGDYNGMKGRLINLFKKYAPYETTAEFVRTVRDYRDSKKYELNFSTPDDEIESDGEMTLPDGFRPVTPDDKDAYGYLIGRGLNDRIISRHRIGFVGADTKDRNMAHRIVFPSYDMYGALNYWTARDYTGKNKQKSKNPKQSKHDIVFNEYLINWYEPVTLVEGPFDHVVTPNSIPLLGKVMKNDSAVYKALTERCRSTVRIFLDDDARRDAVAIYKMLSCGGMSDRLYIVDTASCGHDASDIYRDSGPYGIISTLCSAHEIKEYELAFGI